MADGHQSVDWDHESGDDCNYVDVLSDTDYDESGDDYVLGYYVDVYVDVLSDNGDVDAGGWLCSRMLMLMAVNYYVDVDGDIIFSYS